MTEAAADILKRCKLLHPAVDQFVGSQGKLQLALTHVTLSLTSTLHSLQEIINIVQDKTDESLLQCFQKINSHYTQLMSTLTCLESSLDINVLTKLHKENENFKKTLSLHERANNKNRKKVKENIRKKKREIEKLRKKFQKEKKSAVEDSLEKSTRHLYSFYKDLGDLEEKKLKDIVEKEGLYLNIVLNTFKIVFNEEQKLLKSYEMVPEILSLIDCITAEDEALKVSVENADNDENYKEPESSLKSQEQIIVVQPEPDVIERPQSPESMGSRAGSFLSLSSFASFTLKEESNFKDGRKDSLPLFSTVKRSPSPFGKLQLGAAGEAGRRREARRRFEPSSRPPLPPLPPVAPRSHHLTESLTNLRQKLDEISGFSQQASPMVECKGIRDLEQSRHLSPLVPRSAYVEDSSMKELGYKLRSLSHSASAASTAEWPHLETGEVAALQEEETLEVELTAIPAPGANCPGETEPVVGAVRESEAGRSFTGHAHISRSMSIPARSSSYSCQQVGTSTSMQQINRSASLHIQNSGTTFQQQPRLVLPSPSTQRDGELIATNIQRHIDILDQHQESVMKFRRNDPDIF